MTDADNKYTYSIGICTDATAGQKDTEEAVVQTSADEGHVRKVIGKYTSSSIMAGSELSM